MIRTLGTQFGHFFLLEQDGEVTLIDAGLSGYRDTLEPALAEMGRSIDDVKAIVGARMPTSRMAALPEGRASQRPRCTSARATRLSIHATR